MGQEISVDSGVEVLHVKAEGLHADGEDIQDAEVDAGDIEDGVILGVDIEDAIEGIRTGSTRKVIMSTVLMFSAQEDTDIIEDADIIGEEGITVDADGVGIIDVEVTENGIKYKI